MPERSERSEAKRQTISRRKLLAAAAAAGLAVVPRHVLGGAGFTPPSEILNLACIGVGGKGIQNMRAMMANPDVRITALCDVTEESDYSQFYYRKPGGMGPALKLAEEHYREKDPSGKFKGCARYADYRKLLEREKDIDAVVVSTPDHTHAVITMAAIRRGKHIYCEKPLTRTVEEARTVTLAARAAKVATQMGNHGHSGEGIRLTCEWLWDGAIGEVREVHGWTSGGGRWSREHTGRPEETPPTPAGLDWELWLGPRPHRPYHPAYTPYKWRCWWDFGTGAIGDMACHNLDPAFWALKLGHPDRVEASSDPINPELTPIASIVRYQFPARDKLPPVKLTWYAGGLMPPRPAELEPERNWRKRGNGVLFVGEKGAIVCDGWAGAPRIIPETKMKAYQRPAKTLPRVKNHFRDWLDACKGGPPASANFDYGGPLTEMVLLGNVALRAGKQLHWDGAKMRATNAPEADEFIRARYREGWTL